MSRMDQESTLGGVRVANEVIASIAALASREIDGVVDMDQANARHFGDFLKRQTAHDGVRVTMDTDRALHLEVFLSVSPAARVPKVTEAVQNDVIKAAERMRSLECGGLHAFVSHMACPGTG